MDVTNIASLRKTRVQVIHVDARSDIVLLRADDEISPAIDESRTW